MWKGNGEECETVERCGRRNKRNDLSVILNLLLKFTLFSLRRLNYGHYDNQDRMSSLPTVYKDKSTNQQASKVCLFDTK